LTAVYSGKELGHSSLVRQKAQKPSRLSSKGQVTIPKAVRQAIGIKPGDLVAY
jgi:hypothetical protein